MHIVNIEKVKDEKVSSSLFTADVAIQTPFGELDEPDLLVSYVHFPEGVHNKFHKHSTDQILIVTQGQGFVATEEKKVTVKEGDIILIPAGQIHKHGALPGYKFTHIALTRSNSKLKQVEK